MDPLSLTLLIVGIIAAAGAGTASYINTKKTNEANQQQYEDWKSYNSPESQMDRLRAAGLNPYLVSNVSNTISQPFQVGSNNGIAEALAGVSDKALGGASYANQAYQAKQNRIIQEEGNDIKRQSNANTLLGLQIREKLAQNAIKQGDYRAALLATQGSIAELNRQYLSTTLPYRSSSVLYDSLYRQLQYNYNKEMFPKQLQYYEPMQRAMINNILARTAHLNWYEDFALKQLMQADRHWKNDRWDRWDMFYDELGLKKDRFSLSRDYFDLARDKFQWNILNDIIGYAFPARGKMKGVYKHSPGSYPEYTDYTY